MKIYNYNRISRKEYPKWNGWKILDFYATINVEFKNTDTKTISILEENFYLIKKIESDLFSNYPNAPKSLKS